nr:phospholipase A2 [Micromonospora sp. DSM 115978]
MPSIDVPTVFGLGLADFGVVRADRITDPAAYSEMVWTTDGCSGPTPANVDALFRDACVRHDFGYRNFLSGPRV